jgi:hypothetical protein
MRALIFSLLLLLSIDTPADIFKYVAANGQIYLTNKPTVGVDYRLVVHMRPRTYQSDLKHLSKNKSKFGELIEKAATKHQIEARLLNPPITPAPYRPLAL